MSLLSQIESEVQRIQEQSEAAQAEREAQAVYFEAELKPAMLRAREYFSKLVEGLNIVKPEVAPTYQLNPDNEEEIEFSQSGYEFDYDSLQEPRQLVLRSSCTLDQPLQFFVATKEGAEKYATLLDEHGLSYHRRNHIDKLYEVRSATFTLEGPIQITIRLLADPARRCVYIDLRNIESQPVKRYKFAPEKLDDALLERIGRLLLRQESRLVSIDLDDSFRNELRLKLEAQKAEQARALAEGLAYLEAQKELDESSRLRNRASRALSGVTSRLLKQSGVAQETLH